MASGAPVREIEPARVAGGLGRRVLDSARYCADDEREIVGFALIALYSDGKLFSGVGANFADVPYNRHLFVGMVSEAVRDDMLAWETAREVVNTANGFEEGA